MPACHMPFRTLCGFLLTQEQLTSPFHCLARSPGEHREFCPHIFFLHYVFTDDLLSSIVAPCNLYVQQFISSNPMSYYYHPYEWRNETVEDFFGPHIQHGTPPHADLLSSNAQNKIFDDNWVPPLQRQYSVPSPK